MLYRIHEKKYTEIYTMKLMKANAQEPTSKYSIDRTKYSTLMMCKMMAKDA